MTDIAAAKLLVRAADRVSDVVVVTMHAGAEGRDQQHVRPGTERFLGENRGDSVRFAHAVVDAGADLVVGSGPHVLRGMEWYKGRLIAYSLGNFAGYDVFSLGGPLSTSGILRVTLDGAGRFETGRLVPTHMVGPGCLRSTPRRPRTASSGRSRARTSAHAGSGSAATASSRARPHHRRHHPFAHGTWRHARLTRGGRSVVNELVTSRAKAAVRSRASRRGIRVLAVEALGPMTVLGGIMWAFAQPYRVTFFYPEGKGFWDWAVQPPLLVVLVGLLFALVVAPGIVDDLESGERGDAPEG